MNRPDKPTEGRQRTGVTAGYVVYERSRGQIVGAGDTVANAWVSAQNNRDYQQGQGVYKTIRATQELLAHFFRRGTVPALEWQFAYDPASVDFIAHYRPN